MFGSGSTQYARAKEPAVANSEAVCSAERAASLSTTTALYVNAEPVF
jgi:hypothetical protein